LLEAVNLRDVRMVERGKGLRFTLEPCETFGIAGKRVRQELQRDIAIELVSRAR
jgi:hypothetical protein